MRRFAAIVGGFGGISLLGVVSSVLVIPALTRELGADGWAALAIGQAIGTFFMTVVMTGWGTLGPSLVASNAFGELGPYTLSVGSRFVVFVPCAALAFVTAFAAAPTTNRLGAGLMACAMLVWALGPVWYLVATQQLKFMLYLEALPKLLSATLVVIVLPLASSGLVYPLIHGGVGLAVAVVGLLRFGRASAVSFSAGWAFVREHSLLTTSRALSGGYTSLALPLFSTIAPSATAVASFAAADRLRSLFATGILALSNGLQSWTFSGGTWDARRANRGSLFMAAIATLGAVVFFVFQQPIVDRLFSNQASVPVGAMALLCSLIPLVSLGAALALLQLAPRGLLVGIRNAGLLGSLVGVTSMLAGGSLLGVHGAVLSLVLAELCVCLALVAKLARIERKS